MKIAKSNAKNDINRTMNFVFLMQNKNQFHEYQLAKSLQIDKCGIQ